MGGNAAPAPTVRVAATGLGGGASSRPQQERAVTAASTRARTAPGRINTRHIRGRERLLARTKHMKIKGFEVDVKIFEEAKFKFKGKENVQLILEDYLYNDWDSRYDGIICNPPYFKFHDYDNKTALLEIENKLGVKLTGFTNLYTLFLLKSIHQLKPGGRAAYLVPSEFLNSDYGKLVKADLLKTGTLRHIAVTHRFRVAHP